MGVPKFETQKKVRVWTSGVIHHNATHIYRAWPRSPKNIKELQIVSPSPPISIPIPSPSHPQFLLSLQRSTRAVPQQHSRQLRGMAGQLQILTCGLIGCPWMSMDIRILFFSCVFVWRGCDTIIQWKQALPYWKRRFPMDLGRPVKRACLKIPLDLLLEREKMWNGTVDLYKLKQDPKPALWPRLWIEARGDKTFRSSNPLLGRVSATVGGRAYLYINACVCEKNVCVCVCVHHYSSA